MRGKSILCALLLWAALPCAVPVLAEGPTCKPATATHLTTIKPLSGSNVRLMMPFGMHVHPVLRTKSMHPGIDWGAPRGTPVIAAAAGQVSFVGLQSGEYGNTVIIDHSGGFQTVYAHLSTMAVHLGDCIEAGANVGAAGSTGLATGMGVHFEVRRDGVAVDPMQESTTATN
jgi:murein DD-endopeptidase MepM/ murein hydrolase activator NlpD